MGKGGRPGLFSKPEDPVSMGREGQISFALAEKLGPLGFEVCSLPCDAMVMPHRGPWWLLGKQLHRQWGARPPRRSEWEASVLPVTRGGFQARVSLRSLL